jgi:3-dehydroquinate dehydratase-2
MIMKSRLLILNGPNLNLLGVREPEIYGSTTLAAIEESCAANADVLGVELKFLQSNHEGELVAWIQEARHDADAIIINPAGYSFHSVPILDALKMFPGPIIETHISNIHARDEQHRHSILSAVSTGVICGLGAYGYLVAMQSAVNLLGALRN